MAKNPKESRSNPVTVKENQLALSPADLIKVQAKDEIEKQRRELKQRLLQSGGYQS